MALRRILANQAKLNQKLAQTNRNYHYDFCGRAYMGNPAVQSPPKEFFNYHYVPDNYPDALSGFRIAYRDPFEVQHVFAYENWEYQYDGQWWSMGSLVCNVLFFCTPAFLYLILQVEDINAEKRRGTQNKFYHNNAGYFHFQIYDNQQ
ncbi:hypothetical protein ABPG74_017491 [Tetrahymena malaccensis]